MAFAFGAVLPLLPYLLGGTTLLVPVVLGAIGLFLAGAGVSRFTTRHWFYAGARQLLLGGAAALVTFAIGSVVGA